MATCGSELSSVVGPCENGNEDSVSAKDRKFLGEQSDYQLFNKESAPWSLISLSQ
jgi:hypothetical protein